MKSMYSIIATVLGLLLGLGPWYLIDDPGFAWYFVSLIGLVLVCISGMGAQMKMLGQGDTGEDLFREFSEYLKKKLERKRK